MLSYLREAEIANVKHGTQEDNLLVNAEMIWTSELLLKLLIAFLKTLNGNCHI